MGWEVHQWCDRRAGEREVAHQPVDTDAKPTGGWHSVFERAQKVLVDAASLVVARLLLCGLRLKAYALVDGVG